MARARTFPRGSYTVTVTASDAQTLKAAKVAADRKGAKTDGLILVLPFTSFGPARKAYQRVAGVEGVTVTVASSNPDVTMADWTAADTADEAAEAVAA